MTLCAYRMLDPIGQNAGQEFCFLRDFTIFEETSVFATYSVRAVNSVAVYSSYGYVDNDPVAFVCVV